MPTGDDATLGGMPLVNGALANSAKEIDEYINLTRDYVANAYTFWKPSMVLPIARGGHGATTAAAARTALGITPANINAWGNSGAGTPTLGWNGARLVFEVPGYAFPTDLANKSDSDAAAAAANNRVAKTGDTMSGDLFIPGSSPAVSGFTVCYINSDGRISRGSSAAKYKKFISDVDPLSVGDIFPQLVRYQMRSLDGTGDGDWKLGHIADWLAEHPDQARFVVRINGEIESIDFIQLLLAQVAQLNARDIARSAEVAELAQRVAQLEAA